MSTPSLKVEARGDREIVMTRIFDAPRRLVFDAFTKPELLKRWLTGAPGWSLEVCEIDLRVGGSLRYLWRGPADEEMGMRGVFREINPPDRIVGTEKFDQAWYPGEAVGTVVFTEQGGQTTLTQTIVYESREARDIVLKSPMETGVSMSYNQLAALLMSQVASGESRRRA
jgi:uncharacterized protein YndB with AHSA1/START domain